MDKPLSGIRATIIQNTRQADDDLGAAWAEAEAALPEGWWFEIESRSVDGYRVYVHQADGSGTGPVITSFGITPAIALRYLVDAFRVGS